MDSLNNVPNKPNNVRWTDRQWEAIYAGGKDILVAAAAGSGKTAVLVERIMAKIVATENPLDIDRLLVLTFTNAAAAEMRHRLTELLETKLRENPHSVHIRKQLHLMNMAQISTFHSFYIEIVRSNFHVLDCDPNFKLISEIDRSLLLDEAINFVLEAEYADEDNDEFLQLAHIFSNDRSDFPLEQVLESLLTYAESQISPSLWLTELADAYPSSEITAMEQFVFYPFIKNAVTDTCDEVIAQLEQAVYYCRNDESGLTKLSECLETELANIVILKKHLNEHDWLTLRDYVLATKLFASRVPTIKANECDVKIKEIVLGLRNKSKKSIKEMIDNYFTRDVAAFCAELLTMSMSVKKLGALTLKLRTKFQALKQERNTVDFNDIEHLALTVLAKISEDGQVTPSEVVHVYKERFSEILVDEYQDTNNIQETILTCIKNSSGNLFMVGDVKQSIYRFRLANPTLFMNKYNHFSAHEEAGIKIDLNQNFRSRKEVINGINYIFKRLFNREIGEIDYGDDVALYPGANYASLPAGKTAPIEVHFIEKDKQLESENSDIDAELTTAQYEAYAMAKTIKELVGTYPIFEEKTGTFRPCTWSDIVILYRSKSWYLECSDVFKKMAIPVYAKVQTGYFETLEVSIMLALLKIIDNPYQDVPLVAVLRSSFVGLNATKLTKIRVCAPHLPFYDAIKEYLEKGKDQIIKNLISNFLHKMQLWQDLAKRESVAQLIWTIYRQTNYLDYVSGLVNGKQARENLLGLYQRAYEFEHGFYRGIHRFIRFIDRMRERGNDLGEVNSVGGQDDIVRLVSMHASKGLEFPIVFLGGLGKKFYLKELQSSYIIDSKYGLIMDYIDGEKRLRRQSLFAQVFRKHKKKELFSEEMRIWYVAMTRAKEKLYLFATVNDMETEVNKWLNVASTKDWSLPNWYKISATCPLDWFGAALLPHRDGQKFIATNHFNNAEYLKIKDSELTEHNSIWQLVRTNKIIVNKEANANISKQAIWLELIKNMHNIPTASSHKLEIARQIDWSYNYRASSRYRAKQSITKLAAAENLLQLKDGQEYVQIDSIFINNDNNNNLSGEKKGTLIHLVLEHIPLNKPVSSRVVKETLTAMIDKELITAEESLVIPSAELVAFFNSNIGKRLQTAQRVWRELPFTLEIPIYELDRQFKNTSEKIFVQGTIDCMFLTAEDELVIIDYKTGKFPEIDSDYGQKQIDKYKKQVNYYALAVERITKKRVAERYIYFFVHGGKVISN